MKNFVLILYTSLFYFLFEITNTIVSFVDYTCAAVFLGDLEIAAMGVNSVFYSAVALISGLVFVGTEMACSKNLGRGNTKEASYVFSQMIIVAFVFGIILTLICVLFPDPLVYFMSGFNNDSALLEYSSTYLRTMGFAAPIMIMTSMMISYAQLNNKAFLIPISSASILIVDTTLNIIFCWYFNMGIFGLAFASVISMMVGFLILLLSMRKNSIIKFRLVVPRSKMVGKVFRLGVPLASRRVLTVFARTFINFLLTAVGGTMALSAYAFADCTMYLFSSVGVGLSSSIMLLSSYSLGERNIHNLFDFRRKVKIISVVISLALCALLWWLSSDLSLLLSDYGEDCYFYTLFFIRINAVTLLLSNILEIERNFLQVIGKLFFASAIVFLERFIVLIPALIVLTCCFGVYGTGGAYFVTDIIVLIVIFVYEYCILHINDYVERKFGNVESIRENINDVTLAENIDSIFQGFFKQENIGGACINLVHFVTQHVLFSAIRNGKINCDITAYLEGDFIHLIFSINDKRANVKADFEHIKNDEIADAQANTDLKVSDLYVKAKKAGLKVNKYKLWGKNVILYEIPTKIG